MKLVKRLANLGYGSRKEVTALIRKGWVTDAAGQALDDDSAIEHSAIRLRGKPLDPDFGFVLLLNKPTGYVCSTRDRGQLVYELLPERFALRKPVVSTVGRLDSDTSGLLLMTDDGDFLHKVISPKNHVAKVYEVTTARKIEMGYAAVFASGELMLESETTPLKPASLEIIGEKTARLTLFEGRYHQVRRMFAAVGNHVEALHRARMGELDLGDMTPGQWRLLGEDDLAKVLKT